MKISELSRRSGVPVATIKFYMRERLLAPGTRTGPNRAVYDDHHLERVRLIRTLRDVGALSIDAIRRIVQALDDDRTPMLIEVVDALAAGSGRKLAPSLTQGAGRAQAERDVDALLDELGWSVRPEAAARGLLVDALMGMRNVVRPGMPVAGLLPYAELAMQLAQRESGAGLEDLRPGVQGTLLYIVAGTTLWEMALVNLRRLAHESLYLQRHSATSREGEMSNPAQRADASNGTPSTGR